MPAPPVRPSDKPTRSFGIIQNVTTDLIPSHQTRVDVTLPGTKLHCCFRPDRVSPLIYGVDGAVVVNAVPLHPHPFADTRLTRAFVLVRSGKPPIAYLYRRPDKRPDLRPVSPRTHPYK